MLAPLVDLKVPQVRPASPQCLTSGSTGLSEGQEDQEENMHLTIGVSVSYQTSKKRPMADTLIHTHTHTHTHTHACTIASKSLLGGLEMDCFGILILDTFQCASFVTLRTWMVPFGCSGGYSSKSRVDLGSKGRVAFENLGVLLDAVRHLLGLRCLCSSLFYIVF